MKKIIVFIAFLFALGFFLIVPNVQAQDKIPCAELPGDPTINCLNETAGAVDAFSDQATKDASYFKFSDFLATQAGKVIGLVLSFIGVLFLGLMIYAGIIWMTAQGNEQQVAKAKTLIINGVVGIVIVFAAYALTSFIGTELLK